MYTKKTLIALSTAVVIGLLGAGSLAQASDHEDQSGGFKIGPLGQVMGAPAARNAYAFVPSVAGKQTAQKPTAASSRGLKGSNAYGSTNAGSALPGDEFINGNFIPRGTSAPQVPSHHQEDNYGSAAGKD
jgi:hypothetical protein